MIPSLGTETPPYGWNFAVPRLATMPPPPHGDDLKFLSTLATATESMNHMTLWNHLSLDAAKDPSRQPLAGWS
jgi:hypothetical protein